MKFSPITSAAHDAVYESAGQGRGFAKNGARYWLPHVLMGAADVLAAVITKTR